MRTSSFLCAAALMILTPPAWAHDQPNVVMMVMDNLGWGEIGAYGGGILRGAGATCATNALRL